jgi:1-acyl-sn-glycerol-3-phosphate acyltransferase
MQYLRSKTFDTFWLFWTVLFVPTVPVLILFGSPTRYVRALAVVWTKGTLILLQGVVGLKYLQRCRENIPRQPCIIICNHQSPWETIVFIAHFPNIAIVAKRELLRIPIFGWFVKAFPMIVIDRDAGFKALRQMTRECRTALSEGRSVLIFPEGTEYPIRSSSSEALNSCTRNLTFRFFRWRLTRVFFGGQRELSNKMVQ